MGTIREIFKQSGKTAASMQLLNAIRSIGARSGKQDFIRRTDTRSKPSDDASLSDLTASTISGIVKPSKKLSVTK
jgi:hypothetical protein